MTPHTSFYSDLSSKEMREMAAYEVRRGLINKSPSTLRNCVNKDLLLNSNGNSTPINSNGINSSNNNNSNNNGNNNTNSNGNSNGLSNSNNRSGSSPANLIGASLGNPLTAASLLTASSNLNSSNPSAQLLAQLNCKFTLFLFKFNLFPILTSILNIKT